MKKTIKIDSKKYTTIVKSIETSAEDCLLNEKEWLSYRKTKGTDIARYIAKQAKAANKITKAYQKQATGPLIKSFTDLKKSIKNADKHASSTIRKKEK